MLDRLPAPVRHFALMLISALVAWGIDSVNALGLSPLQAGVAGVILTQIAAYITPLTKQYGVASNDFVDEEDVEDAEI